MPAAVETPRRRSTDGPEPMTDPGGKRWQDQRLGVGITALEVIDLARVYFVNHGAGMWEAWDHNHDARQPGFSNKQLVIVASMLLDRPVEKIDYEQVKITIMRAAGIVGTNTVAVALRIAMDGAAQG